MSPKGHFCTLSLLRRNKAASWDEPKKKRGAGSPPRTLPLSHLMFVLRAACRHKPLWLQPPPPPPPMAPLRRLFGIAFPFLLNHTAVLFTVRPGHLIHQMENLLGCPWIWFGDDQEGKKNKKEKKKKPHAHCLGFCAAFAECIAVYLNKGFCSPWRDERGTSLFTSESRNTHTALLWNTTLHVPCSRVCSSNAALRRPICLADHCLFDVAANVTFLFQSKTQQGVPSVWHSLPSLPRCLFVQIILHGNLHGSFIPWFW